MSSFNDKPTDNRDHGVNPSDTPKECDSPMHHLYDEFMRRDIYYPSHEAFLRLNAVKRSPKREGLRLVVHHAASGAKEPTPDELLWETVQRGDVDMTRFLIESGYGGWADAAWKYLSQCESLEQGHLRCGRLVLEELGRQGKDTSALLLELMHRGLAEGKGHQMKLAATLGAGILEGEALREMVEGICYSCRLSPLFAYLRAGLSPDFRVRGSFTLPMYAAFCGHLKLLRHLHRLGADVLAADEYGYTPLHRACISGQNEVIRWLLEEVGADGAQADTAGRTPLTILLTDHSHILTEPMAPLRRLYLLNRWKHNRCDAVSLLSRVPGYHPSDSPSQGIELLEHAMRHKDRDLVTDLCRRGVQHPVSIQQADEFRHADEDEARTSQAESLGRELHDVLGRGFAENPEWALRRACRLIELGADVNYADGDKCYSVLILATLCGQLSIVNRLVERGADIYAGSFCGAYAYDYARMSGNKVLEAYFRDEDCRRAENEHREPRFTEPPTRRRKRTPHPVFPRKRRFKGKR